MHTPCFEERHKSALIKIVLGKRCSVNIDQHHTKLQAFKHILRSYLSELLRRGDWDRNIDEIIDLIHKAHPFFQSGGDPVGRI